MQGPAFVTASFVDENDFPKQIKAEKLKSEAWCECFVSEVEQG